MYLETLDVRGKDILIYSQNRFDREDNFRIIYKQEPVKQPKPISYADVCNIVKEPVAKNLIVYRLLTNDPQLDAYSTKYGFFLEIDGAVELIYFDPVYAIKDLPHLKFSKPVDQFRFKIQQVGLTNIGRGSNYTEIYSFDMRASEAKNQNDKIFALAVFALDPTFKDEESAAHDTENELGNLREVNRTADVMNKPSIDKNKIDFKSEPGVEKETFKIEKDSLSVFDLFKSTYNSEALEKRKKENIILKLGD
ncbi:hypothetical protein ACSSWA_11425 [Melioribacter sp. Ez-97]|uniref:hypothetical protein n=1 Tax=Melioribacter sp. Ez-97 TaxID=3423434 RepID=UPI003ED90F5B